MRKRSLNAPHPVPIFGRKGHLLGDETYSRLVIYNILNGILDWSYSGTRIIILKLTLEITCFGIYCIAISRNLLERKYSVECSVPVVLRTQYKRFVTDLFLILIPEYDIHCIKGVLNMQGIRSRSWTYNNIVCSKYTYMYMWQGQFTQAIPSCDIVSVPRFI